MGHPYNDTKEESDVNINVGDEICVVRFICNLETLSQLFNTIQYVEGESEIFNGLFEIEYFKCVKGKKRDISTIYNENRSSNAFFQFNKVTSGGPYIQESSWQNFLNAEMNQKIVIWEPIFPDNPDCKTDVAYFQHFLLGLKYIQKKGYRYSVCISAGDETECKYKPIKFGNEAVRLRTLLYLYPYEDLSKIYIYTEYSQSEKDQQKEIKWQHVKAKDSDDDTVSFGKIFPLITISADTYKALVQTTLNQQGDGYWGREFVNLYYLYIDRYLTKVDKKFEDNVNAQGSLKKGITDFNKVKELFDINKEIGIIVNNGKKASNEEERQKYVKLYKEKTALRDKFQKEVTTFEEQLKHYQELQALKAEQAILRILLIEKHGFNKFKNDSLLESLIFIATVVYTEDYKITDKNKRNELVRLHEICVDYAQGVAQLLENILFHVIREEKIGADGAYDTYGGGAGSFTFRIRKKANASYFLKNDNPNENSELSYFMELYVADLNFGQFGGFVGKFLNNVKARGGTWEKRLTKKNVKLPHLFGEKLTKVMKEYFHDGQNVAMHYGLQILNSAVMTGEGELYVTSGAYHDTTANDKNSFFNQCHAGNYVKPDFLWKNGTAYIIYLPIKYNEAVVNYGDVISVANLGCNADKCKGVQLSVSEKHWGTIAISPQDKGDTVEAIRQGIETELKAHPNRAGEIDYIDLSCVTTNNIYAYEVLAKALFLLLNGNKLQNVALINIPKPYDVIKIFRQFALFYNRLGENSNMKDKSVYFIDSNGEIDLLLCGEKINSIGESLAYGKIYGGYSDEAMAIIAHLCKRGGNNP